MGDPNTNRVRVYTSNGQSAGVDFQAFGAGKWGTTVGSGDINGGATDEILAGPGPGAVYGPQVRAFNEAGSGLSKVNFFAYGTLKFGVNVAGSAFDGDAFSEILSGAGPGAVFGPHVRGWNYDGTTLSSANRINFFSYGTLKWGVNVSGGNVDGDNFSEILTAPGPGTVFSSQVRGWNSDGGNLMALSKINFNAFTYAGYGANIAGGKRRRRRLRRARRRPRPRPLSPGPVPWVSTTTTPPSPASTGSTRPPTPPPTAAASAWGTS